MGRKSVFRSNVKEEELFKKLFLLLLYLEAVAQCLWSQNVPSKGRDNYNLREATCRFRECESRFPL